MERLGELWRRLLFLLRRRQFDRDLEEELRFHLEMRAEQYRETGMAGAEARYAARRQFGNVTLLKERSRDMWIWASWETWWRDLRYAARTVRRAPGFSLLIVLVLALGIGASAAIFSVVNAVLVRSLPFRDRGRLVMVWESNLALMAAVWPTAVRGPGPVVVCGPAFRDWQSQNVVFERMAAYRFANFRLVLTGAHEPQQVLAALVSADLFATLAVNPIRGRGFLPEDDRPGGNRVVVVGYGLWQRAFDSDPKLVGRPVRLGGRSYTVVGVMPAAFNFPNGAEVWLPLAIGSRNEDRTWTAKNFAAIARLKPGISVQRAKSDMGVIAAREAQAELSQRSWAVEVTPLDDFVFWSARPGLLALLGGVSFLLLIACANVVSLVLVRTVTRRREIAIRTAVGAGRGRLIRQLVIESAVLAAVGGAGALLAIYSGGRFLNAILPASLPRADETLLIDWRVLAFTLLVSLAASLAVGLLPAVQASRANLVEDLKEGGRGAGSGTARGRLRRVLSGAQVALALALLVGAGLMTESFVRLGLASPGFDPENRLVLRIFLPGGPPRQRAFLWELLERVQALPGVATAGAGYPAPLSGEVMGIGFEVEGRPVAPGSEPVSNFHSVTPGYLQALGVRLLRGRDFSDQDRADTGRVVIINEAMARTFWPNEDPIGKRIVVEFGNGFPAEIIGVIGEVKDAGVDARPGFDVYVAVSQVFPSSDVFLVVHARNDPRSLAGVIRELIRSIDKQQPVRAIKTMEEIVAGALAPRRFYTVLFGFFSAAALALAAVGIYGVIAYSVTQRTHEIGIRMALGAAPGGVLRLILREAAGVALAGVGVGLALGLATSRFLAGLLYGVGATNARTFALAAVVLLAAAVIAGYLPARRATRVDPVVALRHE